MLKAKRILLTTKIDVMSKRTFILSYTVYTLLLNTTAFGNSEISLPRITVLDTIPQMEISNIDSVLISQALIIDRYAKMKRELEVELQSLEKDEQNKIKRYNKLLRKKKKGILIKTSENNKNSESNLIDSESYVEIRDNLIDSVEILKIREHEYRIANDSIQVLNEFSVKLKGLKEQLQVYSDRNKNLESQINLSREVIRKDSLLLYRKTTKYATLKKEESELFNLPLMNPSQAKRKKGDISISNDYINLKLPFDRNQNQIALGSLPKQEQNFKLLQGYCQVTNEAYKIMQSMINIRNSNLSLSIYDSNHKPIVEKWKGKYLWIYDQFQIKLAELKRGENKKNNSIIKQDCNK